MITYQKCKQQSFGWWAIQALSEQDSLPRVVRAIRQQLASWASFAFSAFEILLMMRSPLFLFSENTNFYNKGQRARERERERERLAIQTTKDLDLLLLLPGKFQNPKTPSHSSSPKTSKERWWLRTPLMGGCRGGCNGIGDCTIGEFYT